jgi:threonine/homoserine/homoserine lactone efflux protein
VLHSETMIATTQLVVSGLIVGVIIAAPVGPVNIVCIQRTLERGFWGGFAAGIGAVLADGLIAFVAAFGITAISGVLANHKFSIQLIGGFIMVGFGVKLFTAEPKLAPKQRVTSLAQLRRIVDKVPERLRPAIRLPIWKIVPHASIIPQTFFLTITNPGAILGLFAIFGGLGSVLGGINSYVEALTLVFSVMAGSLLWWAVLSQLIDSLRGKLNEGRLKIINQVAGIVLVAFGGLLFVQLALGMMGNATEVSSAPEQPHPLTRRLAPLLGNPI